MPPSPAAAARDPFFDNAKYLLIVLVVCGHNWAPLEAGIPLVKAVYSVVYLFHMPAFIVISGYFSRGFTGRPDQIRALISKVLVPYLIFQTAFSVLDSRLSGEAFFLHPTEPKYVLWFLVALVLWRITAPVWQAVRWPVAVAALVSLAAGLFPMGYDLALPRVLMFLPWFVLGLRLRPEHFHRLRAPAVRRLAPVVVLAAVAVAYGLADRIRPDWFNMQYDTGHLQVGVAEYLGIRLLLFVLSALLVVAFFALVPTRRTFFTALGAATMFPFLVHGLLVETAETYGFYDLLSRTGPASLAITAALAVALAFLLSSTPVRRLLRPVVEPRFPRLLTPTAPSPAPSPKPSPTPSPTPSSKVDGGRTEST
ncbi:acyltransferase family protein [Streptomyces sp. T-3]|nr:acyltransferase family protein [Streptomyces sp. T-3]